MRLETERLIITQWEEDMAESMHLNSLDEDNRRYVPDEVFETLEDAQKTMRYLMQCYHQAERGPLVYPILLKDGTPIGYVQAVPYGEEWELGYHIAKDHTHHGYATEAVRAFLPAIMEQLHIREMVGVCVAENLASCAVLKKCGFTLEYQGMGPYQEENRMICIYRYALDPPAAPVS